MRGLRQALEQGAAQVHAGLSGGADSAPEGPAAVGSGSGYSVVMGRDWVSQILPAGSMTHSTSWGSPNRLLDGPRPVP